MHEPGLNWMSILTEGNLIGQLESLRLRGTDVNDFAAETLAGCEKLCLLTHLDLAVNSIGERGLRALASSKNLTRLALLDLRNNIYDTENGGFEKGFTPGMRQLLEARFGNGVLLDGDPGE
jgi:hypothetical protein